MLAFGRLCPLWFHSAAAAAITRVSMPHQLCSTAEELSLLLVLCSLIS
jgi:hypothetical protein